MAYKKQTLSKQVQIRDIGLCRCCGFRGSEVHHVIPTIYGGKDEVTNMVYICHVCHIDAPDTKEDFYQYMNIGGSRLQKIWGTLILEFEKDNRDIIQVYPTIKKIIKSLQNVDLINAMEHYGYKKPMEIEDVDFGEINPPINHKVV
jgi:hypothetical protein